MTYSTHIHLRQPPIVKKLSLKPDNVSLNVHARVFGGVIQAADVPLSGGRVCAVQLALCCLTL